MGEQEHKTEKYEKGEVDTVGKVAIGNGKGEEAKLKDVDNKTVERTASVSPVSDRLYSVRPILNKGKGFVTTSKIRKGTRILSESPIFKVPRDTTNIQAVEGVIIRALKDLDKDQQRSFFTLHNAYRKGHSPFFGIARTNALPLGSEALEGGLFLEASRVNHACRHNAQNTWNANLNQLTIHAFKDIERGEEITISYLDGSQGYSSRQLSLKTGFGFNCICDLYSLAQDQRQESDQRLEEITRLDSLIGDGMRIMSAPVACLHDAHKLLCLLREEQIDDARIARLFYDALQVAIANGDQARAKVFAEMAYAARIVLEGNDSPESSRLRGLMEKPSNHRLYGTSMR